MIFNGRVFAKERLAVLQEERKQFGPLSLGIVVGSHDPVTSSYVKIKEKNAQALDIALVRYVVDDTMSTDEVLKIIADAHQEDGVIVQLPLPMSLSTEKALSALHVSKDVDVISPGATKLFIEGKHSVMPPVASAINEIIDAENIHVEGKRAVVVGKGRLVGVPAYHLMKARRAEVVTLEAGDELSSLKDADIIILGAGSPFLVTPEMVKEGVVVFDAGTSESGGVVVGDADPAVAHKASFFTPVPGGIGPVAVVEIFTNLLTLKMSIL